VKLERERLTTGFRSKISILRELQRRDGWRQSNFTKFVAGFEKNRPLLCFSRFDTGRFFLQTK
jgi:hypothetical protein